MGIKFDSSEMRAVSSRLGEGGKRVGAQASAAFRKTVFDIEGDAKILAPVDTGALRGSISSTITGDGRSGHMDAEIGPTVDYAVHVHDGTSRMAGRPFLTDAYDRRVPGFESVIAALGGSIL